MQKAEPCGRGKRERAQDLHGALVHQRSPYACLAQSARVETARDSRTAGHVGLGQRTADTLSARSDGNRERVAASLTYFSGGHNTSAPARFGGVPRLEQAQAIPHWR